MCPIFPSQLPLPLITLRLTTSSILDTVLVDAQDQTPLFSVETLDNRTVVYMYDHRRQSDHQLRVAEVAAIQWPILPFGAIKTKQSPEVTILGDYQPASSFLKKSTFGGTRKFYIPGQTHPLKWKHVGEHYECTLCSHACTAHRAVATFEPAHTTSAARLAIYASTVTGTYATSEYQTVDMDMMVYLIVTSILLSAPHQSTVSTPVAASPRANCLLPSPVSSMGNYKIDLLAPDEAFVPSHPSPLRSSRGSPASSSSCNSSLPGSPVTPSTELSPISHESSTSSGSYLSRSSSMLVGRRQSTRHSTPPAGPNSITPYHLPPAPVHSSPVQRSPPTLRLQVPSPMASQQPSPRTGTPYDSNNALLLDTSSIPMIQSTEQHIHFHHLPSRQFTIPIPPPTDELPPAYNEIEWTVRVKQPREMATGLAY